jgi:hypothetical protein
MEIELSGFDRERRLQRESKLKQHRRDLDEVRRGFHFESSKYVLQKTKETAMGANLEEMRAWDHRQHLI